MCAIRLCTNGFLTEENQILVEKLKNALTDWWQVEIEDTAIYVNKENEIMLRLKPALMFLYYIGGQSPVQCFDYKFTFNRSKFLKEFEQKLSDRSCRG